MIKPVVFTPNARADLENIADYLMLEWGSRVLENFLLLYEERVNTIASHPARYPVIHQASLLRKTVLTKHNIVLYREKENCIEIVAVFDTRQDPEKIQNL